MGDFVEKAEVDQIRNHYRVYVRDNGWRETDNRATPKSEVYDASTFREVSSWYVDRLLRYIEVEEWIKEEEWEGTCQVFPAEMFTLLLSSVRYALGRTTYITEETAHLVRKYQHVLLQDQVKQIVREIEEAVSTGRAGMEMDVKVWAALCEDLKKS